ncbi:MAG: hypothetical protein ACE5FL_01770 [Myxococcota bacterium]
MSDDRAGDIAPPAPRPLAHRVVAGIALVALLTAAGLASCWILTGRADFGVNGPPDPPSTREETPHRGTQGHR